MKRMVWIILGVVILVIASGASFYGGMVYGEGRAQSARAGTNRFGGGANGFNNGQGFQGGQGAGGQRGGGVFGQITEVGDGYVMVADNNGKQTKITVTDTTLIEKNASVKLSDLANGDTVIVSGSQQSDGTFTARSVQVAPAGRFGFGQGNGNGGGNGAEPTPSQ